MVTATAMLIASSVLPRKSDTAAESNKSSMRRSLKALMNRSHSGSGSSWGSSLGPSRRNLASASDGIRPRVREEFRRCSVSSGDRREYAEVPACVLNLSQSLLHVVYQRKGTIPSQRTWAGGWQAASLDGARSDRADEEGIEVGT